MALALGLAFRRLHGLPADAAADAATLLRGARSGVGIGLFEQGGLMLDAGRGAHSVLPPIVSRLAFPELWRVVLLIDDGFAGAHGEAERAAFAALPPFPPETAADLCRRALMQVLPGVAEADFAAFGAGLSAIQRRLGDYFAPAQGGGRFTSPRVGAVAAALERAGAIGVGQSSWGPTGFAFARDPDEAAHWAALARDDARRRSRAGPRRPRQRRGLRRAHVDRPEEKMAKIILHMLTPLAHMSPFDVNMAADAGFDVVTTYTNVTLAEVSGLTQDAMFSRSPRDALAHGRCSSAARTRSWRSTCSRRRRKRC